jgi:hypothetical protein
LLHEAHRHAIGNLISHRVNQPCRLYSLCGAAKSIISRGCAVAFRPSASHIARMCGRYASYLPSALIALLFGTVNQPPALKPTWNMAPTDDALVVRSDPESGRRSLDVLTWGLVPYFTKDLKAARKPINARAETVARSGMFKAAFAKRRCLVPATAYYEWRTDPEDSGAMDRV